MFRKYIFILGSLLMLAGCATCATGPLFSETPSSIEGKGVLYIFQAKAALFLSSDRMVRINDKPFVKLNALGYSYVHLVPGVYKLSVEGGFITEIEIKEGQELFEKYYCNGYENGVNELPHAIAVEELKKYRYIEPLNTEF